MANLCNLLNLSDPKKFQNNNSFLNSKLYFKNMNLLYTQNFLHFIPNKKLKKK